MKYYMDIAEEAFKAYEQENSKTTIINLSNKKESSYKCLQAIRNVV